MNNFWNNLFGTIGRHFPATHMDFIPTGPNGDATQNKDILWVKGSEAVWLGLNTIEMQYWAYVYCSPLAAVIDRLAECDINGEIEFLKNNETENYSNSPVAQRMKDLIKKPNPLQTWEEYRGQQVVFKKIYGYCPVFAMTATGMDTTYTSYLWNLNPYYARPVRNDKFNYNNGQDSIKEWKINIFGETYIIPEEKVFILKDGYVNGLYYDYLLPLSKIAGLDFAISNICATMEADNVLLRKKGPLGFISHDPKPDNVAGYIPMKKEEKLEIQQELANYGLTWNQFQYVVSKLPVRWNPISYNVRELMTKETARQSIDMICDRYNYPAELMSGKNATYENRNSAEKFLYQNNIMPSSLRDMRVYNDFFKLEEYRIKMVADYDHLPVLQEDIVKQGQASEFNAQANLILFQNSVITLNQFRINMLIDTVPGDDIYYDEAQKKYGSQPAPLKVVPPTSKEKVA